MMFNNNYKINWISKSGRHYTQWCKELSSVLERVEMNFRNRIETDVIAGDDGRTVGQVWNGSEGWTWFCENDEN